MDAQKYSATRTGLRQQYSSDQNRMLKAMPNPPSTAEGTASVAAYSGAYSEANSPSVDPIKEIPHAP